MPEETTKMSDTPAISASKKSRMKKKGNEFNDTMTTKAQKLTETCRKFKTPRLRAIQKYLDTYFGKTPYTMKGRSNLPVPILAKYVDALRDGMDDGIMLRYGKDKKSHLRLAQKLDAAADKVGAATHDDWNRKDRMARVGAIFTGVAFYNYRAESSPKYKSILEIVTLDDMLFEPKGGNNLKNHLFVGKDNIWRTEAQLKTRVAQGIYDAEQVKKLISRVQSADYKRNYDQTYTYRLTQYKALGIDMENNSYVGTNVYPLSEVQMVADDGKKYYLLFHYDTGIWLRCEPLKDVLGYDDNYSYDLWQTHEDANNVLSKSPCDDIWPLAEGARVKVNMWIDADTKRTWGMRGINPRFFSDVQALEWTRPDQIVIGGSVNENTPMSNGVHEFQAQDVSDSSTKILNYLDGLMSDVTGVNAGSRSPEEEKVGVFYGQLQKAARRLGLYNKAYKECWERIGMRFYHGLKLCLNETMMIKIIGTQGVEWDELKNAELENEWDFGIAVLGSNSELEMNEALKKQQQSAIDIIIKDQDLKKELNPRWVVEKLLESARFEQKDIKAGMNTKEYGNEEEISRADAAVDQIMKGKKPKPYRGATTAFIQYILNYAMDNEVSDKQFATLGQYAIEHKPIAEKNLKRKQQQEAMNQPAPDQNSPEGAAPGDAAALAANGGGGPGGPAPAATPAPAAPVVGSNGMSNMLQGK